MRHYSDILKDIEKYLVDNNLNQDLESLHDWQKHFIEEAKFCSGTATWLYRLYCKCLTHPGEIQLYIPGNIESKI